MKKTISPSYGQVYNTGQEIEDLEKIKKNASSQEHAIAQICKRSPEQGFPFFKLVRMTGYNQDSVKRSLSNLSGSGKPDNYCDKYGRYPMIKSDVKVKNPLTGVKVRCYQWNPKYGKPKKNYGQQMSFDENLNQKN